LQRGWQVAVVVVVVEAAAYIDWTSDTALPRAPTKQRHVVAARLVLGQ
jgi:hypothetical protein